MADTVILAEQQISGFTSESGTGAQVPVSLVSGETYKVLWDGTEYTCIAYTVNMPVDEATLPFVFIGNQAFVEWTLNGEVGDPPDAVEPFAINQVPADLTGGVEGVLAFTCAGQMFGACTSDTHTVAIYKVSEAEAEEDKEYLIWGSTLKGIADAIRAKNGTTDEIVVADMATKISEITGGGGSSDDFRYVTFKSYDGAETYGVKAVANGDDCADPIARGLFDTPTIENTEELDYYPFSNWSLNPNSGVSDDSALKNVSENRTVYAVFKSAAILAKGNCGTDAKWRFNEDGIFTISGTGKTNNYSYPGTARPWNDYSTQIKAVVIDDGITSIGNYSFHSCSNLTSITIPDSVTIIGSGVLGSCTALTRITIPNSVTSIGGSAFKGTALTRITIPGSITSIGTYTFDSCASLTNVTISSGVTALSNCMFYKCTALTGVTIPDSVTTIGLQAFYGCTQLSSVTIGSGVTSIPSETFRECTALTRITIPDTVTSIDNQAFYGCTQLSSVTIGSGVTSIGAYAFNNCSALTYALFKTTSGWWVNTSSTATSGTSVSVTSTSTAAQYLRGTYVKYYWRCS